MDGDESDYCPGTFNWELCILCQKQTGMKLQCPKFGKRGDSGVGYKTFVSNFAAFVAANAVPEWVRFTLPENVDVVETLTHNNAKWGKTSIRV